MHIESDGNRHKAPPIPQDIIAQRQATQAAMERGELTDQQELAALVRMIQEERKRQGIVVDE